MKSTTIDLKKQLLHCSSLLDKMEILKNKYKGETCYVLTAGPSLNDINKNDIKSKLSDKLVFSVKQTFNIAPEIVDFHLLNPWNYTLYNYKKNNKAIVVSTRVDNDPETPGLKSDMIFNVVGVGRNVSPEYAYPNRLAIKRNYDDYLFSKTLDRPWGPGIIYELAIYLALHLGVNKIVILGWDIGELDSNKMSHFYDTKSPQILKYKKNLLQSDGKLSYLNMFIKKIFKKNNVYNEPGFIKDDVKIVADSTESLFYWLKEKHVDLEIISTCSLASEIIPRVKL
ncbi:hypothetical protein IO418_001484 [Campylobacter lari]|nr:hypothetical protein [Campylobacter lari]EAK9869209.1 hypothetical protein [Campylobacter lari]EAK9882098.1 hypothetical protein [Campylobacter lari]EGK8092961.1 hypothetical protein [Campylobacter lari]EJV0519502.1 hypothetical protein [Campylobacter lari]